MSLRKSQKGILKRTNKYDCVSHNHLDYRPIYRVWNTMIRRCTNPKCDMYHNYGGRGIKVCDRWLDKNKGFVNFWNDMGPRPVDEKGRPYQIDRINPNGDYCPENCRWASIVDNANNKTNNFTFIVFGEPMSAASLSKMLKINKGSITNRMRTHGEDKYTALFHILERKGYEMSLLTSERNML